MPQPAQQQHPRGTGSSLIVHNRFQKGSLAGVGALALRKGLAKGEQEVTQPELIIKRAAQVAAARGGSSAKQAAPPSPACRAQREWASSEDSMCLGRAGKKARDNCRH